MNYVISILLVLCIIGVLEKLYDKGLIDLDRLLNIIGGIVIIILIAILIIL